MGEYGNVKSSRVVKYLTNLSKKNSHITFGIVSKHYKIRNLGNGEWFTVSANHPNIAKANVIQIQKRLIKWGICTKEEFDKAVK